MAAQQMVEKAFLPVLLGNSKLEQSLANHVPQRLNPTGQGDPIYWKGCKEMDVIWHYDIATNRDIMLLRLDEKDAKRLVHLIACQHALTLICVERDEVEGPKIVKETTESGRSPRPFFSLFARHG